jgi:hypothetical protein
VVAFFLPQFKYSKNLSLLLAVAAAADGMRERGEIMENYELQIE